MKIFEFFYPKYNFENVIEKIKQVNKPHLKTYKIT